MVYHTNEFQILNEWTELDSLPPEIAVQTFFARKKGLVLSRKPALSDL
jgi:hypothetical protein